MQRIIFKEGVVSGTAHQSLKLLIATVAAVVAWWVDTRPAESCVMGQPVIWCV